MSEIFKLFHANWKLENWLKREFQGAYTALYLQPTGLEEEVTAKDGNRAEYTPISWQVL